MLEQLHNEDVGERNALQNATGVLALRKQLSNSESILQVILSSKLLTALYLGMCALSFVLSVLYCALSISQWDLIRICSTPWIPLTHDFHWLMASLLFSFLCLSHSLPPSVCDILQCSTEKRTWLSFIVQCSSKSNGHNNQLGILVKWIFLI